MLKSNELNIIITLLKRKATKEQLLSLIEYIEVVPLMNKMTNEEYEDYYNNFMKGKSFQKYYLKRKIKDEVNW